MAIALGLAARWARAWVLERRWRRPLLGVPVELAHQWAQQDPRGIRRPPKDADEQPPELSAIDVLFHLSRLDRKQPSRFHSQNPPADFRHLLSQFAVPQAASTARRAEPGEQMLAQQLSHDGHDVLVEAPGGDELPGCPALVDGTPVRLVSSPDPRVIQRYLEREPDLAVVTVAEHAEIFAGQARVVALPEVSHRASEPAKQIAKGDVEWLSSAGAGLLDNAAASAGGWAGARAGAMLGALLGPVGVAAGGFLGGLLGKQLAENAAAGAREKRLRHLLNEQESFLAKVPALAAEAQAAQARHLRSVATELTRAEPGFQLWPSAGSVACEQLAAEYQCWQQRVAKQSRQLESWLKTKPSAPKLRARGAQLLSEGRLGWSRGLLEARSRLLQLALELEAERRRLGKG